MKLSIYFRLRLTKDNINETNKEITIRCFVNVDGQKEIPFSTGRSIESIRWSQESERVINDGTWEAQNINNQLNGIYNKLFKNFDFLQSIHKYVDSVLLVDEYNQSLIPPKKKIEYYEEYLKLLKEKVGPPKKKGGIEEVTYRKWETSKKHFENFLKIVHNKAELYISHITTILGAEFLEYMEKQSNNRGEEITEFHAYRTFMNLSKVLDAAVKERHIKENLLKFSKAIRPDTSDNEIFYLSEESLLTLYDATMLTRLERGVVDAFILMAFTGFAYSDYMEFRVNPNEFIICENGAYFLKKRRYKDRFHKNPVVPIIPYMQIHKTILERYDFDLPSFPVETINKNIKIIAQRLGIQDSHKITSHIGRKSAATLFVNEDSIEPKIVSRMLGHRNPATTWKHYAVIRDESVQRQTAYLALKE